MNIATFCPAATTQISTSLTQGLYMPRFFELEGFALSRVDFYSHKFNSEDVELKLLKEEFSFAYLKDGEMRTLKAYDNKGVMIPFDDFIKRLNLKINTSNIYKCGKYLSRIFRPVKYGGFYKDVDIHINNSPKYKGSITDGISLISKDLALSLGWDNVKVNSSAQFTLLWNGGFVKGNCVVSDKIKHDIIIYTDDNIKHEISLNNGLAYISLEPLKLSKHLRLDIQTMLNLWDIFGAEQYLSWVYDSIEEYKQDLMEGKLMEYLDDFNAVDYDMYQDENWTLRKAVYHNIDYRQYPGLFRSAWMNYRNSIVEYGINKCGEPAFRIPVPGGHRGYFRVDLRDHDEDGNFTPTVDEGEVTLDKLGNIWIHPNDIEEFLLIKGGADLDDSAGIIPIEKGKAIIYRNPNQYGEYGIHKINYKGVNIGHINKTIGIVPIKGLKSLVNKPEPSSTGIKLLDDFLSKQDKHIKPLNDNVYTTTLLIKTYHLIQNNTANIGTAANAEMIRASIGIYDKELFRLFFDEFSFNLENIIDATVKEGTGAEADMQTVYDIYRFISESDIEIPKALVNRFPGKYRDTVLIRKDHPLDELLEAIKYLIEKADTDILGRGTVSKSNRVKGAIDNIEIPIVEIGQRAIENGMYDKAVSLHRSYNKSMAIMMDKTKGTPPSARESSRKESINRIQTDLLKKLKPHTAVERKQIMECLAYEIYKSNKSVHDSILWISDKGNLKGTAIDTINMLADIGLADQVFVDENINLERFTQIEEPTVNTEHIRLWSKEKLSAEKFNAFSSLVIKEGKAILGDNELNIGDECNIESGIFTIKDIVPSISRRDASKILNNSITVYLADRQIQTPITASA